MLGVYSVHAKTSSLELQDLTISNTSPQLEEYIEGSFVIKNTSELFISDVYTTIQIGDGDKRQYGPFYFSPGEARVMSIHYAWSPFLIGKNIPFRLGLLTEEGEKISLQIPLNLSGHPTFHVASTSVPKTYDMYKKTEIRSFIANLSQGDISIIPQVRVYKGNIIHSSLAAYTLPQIDLTSPTTTVSFPLMCDACTAPGIYTGKIILTDTKDRGIDWGNPEINFTFTVPGTRAQIYRVQSDRSTLKKHEEIQLFITYYSDFAAEMSVQLISEDDIILSEKSVSLLPGSENQDALVLMTSTSSAERLRVVATLKKDGKVLDSYTTRLTDFIPKKTYDFSIKLLDDLAYVMGLVCVASCVGAIAVFISKKKSQKPLRK